MNFVEAVITLLKEAGEPVHVEDLCERAVERNLLSRPGSAPLRSMKGRLTTELNRGDESRLIKLEDDRWALRDVEGSGPHEMEGADRASGVPTAEGTPATDVDQQGEFDLGDIEDLDDLDDLDDAYDADEEPGQDDEDEDEDADEDDDEGDDEGEYEDEGEFDEDEGDEDEDEGDEDEGEFDEDEGEADEDEDEGDEDDEEEAVAAAPPPPMTPEEAELASIYSDESGSTTPIAELSEYRDEHTEDEDRPMLPEIRADRRSRNGRPGRVDRKRRRRRRGGDSDESRPISRPRQRERSSEEPREAAPPVEAATTENVIVSSAEALLAEVPRGQALPVRQLTQEMRKQGFLDGNPDQLWRLVKSVLVLHISQRAASGRTSRIEHRGRGVFALRLEHRDAKLATAEERFAAAVAALEHSHWAHFQESLQQLSTKMLERVAHVYLQVTGWSDIEWIKRVDRSSYATATLPGGEDRVLVGVRSGPEEVDRRGVGELRAGVAAKDLTLGVLLSPCELSDAARSELERDGQPLIVRCGDEFMAALQRARVGISQRQVSVQVIDEDFFEAVLH